MKNIFSVSLLLLTFVFYSAPLQAQKKIKAGVVKFELNTESMGNAPEIDMMAGTSLDFYFKDKFQRMDMSMMGGLMRIQTFVQLNQLAASAILMDMMGEKYQIIDLQEKDLSESNSFMNLDNVKKITYDKKDKKLIAKYPCYLAEVTTNDGQIHKYYITERIKPPVGLKQGSNDLLKGYPLELIVPNEQYGSMVFTATSVSAEVTDQDFNVPDGYQKMTMAEFEKQMNSNGQ